MVSASTLTGAAGEHYVMSQLLRRGFIAALTQAVVAQTLSECHQAWLAQPGKKGQPHKDNDMRRFLPGYDHLPVDSYRNGWLSACREAWDLLQRQA